jgi:hypothetical protein
MELLLSDDEAPAAYVPGIGLIGRNTRCEAYRLGPTSPGARP